MGVDALFCFAVSAIGLILIVILLYLHNEPSSRWLILLLFIFSAVCFFTFLFESRYVLDVPVFFRIGPFLNYLSAPALLFYVKYLMDEKRKLKWTDALHLIPALIYFVDYLPLFTSSAETKRQIILALYEHKEATVLFREGWFIPEGVHYIGRHLIALGYTIYLIILLKKIRRADVRKLLRNVQIKQWLRILIIHFLLYTVFGIITYLFKFSQYAWLATVWIALLIFTSLILTLFLRPGILYGRKALHTGMTLSKTKSAILHDQIPQQVHDSLQLFMENRSYLNKNIKIKDVADELGVQPYILSAYINQVYHMRFNDLINWCRVQYIKDGLKKGDWAMLTLEAIAEEAGFTNRTTFLTAFKKFTGVTPTAFLHGERQDVPDEKKPTLENF